MADTVFSKIIRGEIPCHRVYEDAQVLAFLDINPLSRGHLLVIPKEPAATLDQLSDEAAAALGRVLPRLCRAVIAATGVREYNVLENNGSSAHQAIGARALPYHPQTQQPRGSRHRLAAHEPRCEIRCRARQRDRCRHCLTNIARI